MKREEELEKAAKEYLQKMGVSKDENLISLIGLSFWDGARYADEHTIMSEHKVTLSFHVCDIPCPEEVMAGANAKYEAYFVSVPKSLIPDKLLEVITKDSDHKYISQVALLKDGLV